MTEKAKTMGDSKLTRRAALKRAAIFLGGTMTVTQLGLLSGGVAAIGEDEGPRFLGAGQFLMLRQLVDLIIPETDTPGAVGARVHHFIDLMLAEWASPARQSRYVAGLEDIDRRALVLGSKGFAETPKAGQLELLRQLDAEAFAPDSPDTFFGELKKMTLFAYYSSETGATGELRFQRIPGDYQPCLAMEEDGRAWFWNGYSYGL